VIHLGNFPGPNKVGNGNCRHGPLNFDFGPWETFSVAKYFPDDDFWFSPLVHSAANFIIQNRSSRVRAGLTATSKAQRMKLGCVASPTLLRTISALQPRIARTVLMPTSFTRELGPVQCGVAYWRGEWRPYSNLEIRFLFHAPARRTLRQKGDDFSLKIQPEPGKCILRLVNLFQLLLQFVKLAAGK